MIKYLIQFIPFRSDMEKILFERELDALKKESVAGILGLAIILLFTFLTLGVAVGSLDYLEKRMNNPMTNWLNVSINNENRSEVQRIMQYFNEEKKRTDFGLQKIIPFRNFIAEFVNLNGGAPFFFGRAISSEKDSSLIDMIISGENLIHLHESDYQYAFENRGAIIVTEKLLKQLGVHTTQSQKKIKVLIDQHFIFLNIIAVVRSIPSGYEGADFLCSPRFQNFYEASKTLDHSRGVFSFISDINNPIEIEHYLHNQRYEDAKVRLVSDFSLSTNQKHSLFNIHANIKGKDRLSILEILSENFPKNDFFLHYPFTTEYENNEIIDIPENLTFVFNNWEAITQFDFFVNEFFPLLKLDLAHVKEKENFNLVSKLTFILAIFLFTLGISSVGILLSGILKTHLQRNYSNIGIFQAFGWKRKNLNQFYLKVIAYFIGTSLIPAISIGIILHFSLPPLMSIWNTESIFNFLNIYIFLAILFFASLCHIVLYIVNLGIIKKSPGDLIYQR